MKSLVSNGLCVEGELGDKSFEHCTVCMEGKMTRRPFFSRPLTQRATKPMERLHLDLIGPFPCKSTYGAAAYVLTVTDERSGRKFVFLLHHKSQAFEVFSAWHRYWTHRLEFVLPGQKYPLLYLHSDRGGEFTGRSWTTFCTNHGIKEEFSLPYTPQQNGMAERTNRVLLVKTRTLMVQSGAPKRFWGDAIKMACVIANMSPYAPLQGAAPTSVWPEDSWATDVSSLLTFGCEAYAWIPAIHRDKCDGTGRRCVYMGPDTSSKAHRLWDPSSSKYILARPEECKANENVFPFKQDLSEGEPVFDVADKEDGTIAFDFCKQEPPAPAVSVPEPSGVQIQEVPAQEAAPRPAPAPAVPAPVSHGPAVPASVSQPQGPQQKVESKKPSRSSTRSNFGKPPGEFWKAGYKPSYPIGQHTEANKRARELATPSPSPASASVPSVSAEGERSSEGVDVQPQVASQAHSVVFAHLLVKELNTKLKEEFNEDTDDADLDKLISDPSLEPSVCVYTAVADPTTRRQALASPNAEQWQKAMQEEVDTITRKGTFSLATLPPGRIALPVKWVFKTKLDAQGAISRFKARLVAKGFKEIPGQDYDETFSPVAQYRSLRILLAIAAQYDLDLHQMDVVSAFLNGKVEHEIYIQQPEGFDDKSGRVWRLHKAIYGLKQASRCWNAEVHSTLINLGFAQCRGDTCLYVLNQDPEIVILLLYVDDMVVASTGKRLREWVVDRLLAEYEMKFEGELHWILGMRVTRNRTLRTI